ncbi:Uncharacterized membrane protein [Lentzea xinjiangensis]|uniref:Uncharacterized membrane protein n=1 Tax=Lentzea xinjiangensis TaxID=402600 RepID=A0A1H9TUK8_9PSEU|nr:DUF2231 domain-containing protein [Lentzea xinjiangensis]SES00915.1 Uncharacterized membrane protein [Lentzea xinjiangensis]
MRLFSFRPAFTLRGRKAHGLRGLAGKPLHPPLTDIPVGAYVLAAAFDVISVLTGGELAADLYRAGTFALIGGGAVSLLAAATGVADWLGSTPRRTQAWRTVNAHALVMTIVTLVVLATIALRLTVYADATATPAPVLVLSLVAAGLTGIGAAIGGSLVYDHGFNVETATDSPVWHESETDLFPADKKDAG